MIELFTRKKYKLNYSISQPAILDYIRKIFYREMSNVVKYYYNNILYIKSDHILVRTMETILPDINLDVETFYFHVFNNSKRVASNMGFSTTYSNGIFFNSVFYKDTKEVILNSDYMVNDNELKKYDKEYSFYAYDYIPCRSIYTRDINLGLPYPDGSKSIKSLYNVNVYEINLSCLCLEYRCWAKTMMESNKDFNIKQYISKIVLPKMMFNHLNLAVFNRYLYGNNIKYNKIDRNHPFVVSDLTRSITSVINAIKKYNDDTRRPVEAFMDTIPCIFNTRLLDATFIYNKIYTRSNSWVLWLARLPYIVAIIKNIGVNGIIANKAHMNLLPMYIKEMRNRSIILLEILPSGLKEEYNEYIRYIDNIIYKR